MSTDCDESYSPYQGDEIRSASFRDSRGEVCVGEGRSAISDDNGIFHRESSPPTNVENSEHNLRAKGIWLWSILIVIIESPPRCILTGLCQNTFCTRWRWTTLVAAVILLFCIPTLVVFLTLWRGHDTDTSINNSQQSNDYLSAYYLQDLRINVLGIDVMRLRPDAAQLLATDWMTFTDTPRLSLNDTVRLEQRYALLVLYFGMGGQSWSFRGWINDPGMHECDWAQVYCDGMDHVVELYLGDYVQLTGSLVQEISLLSSLTSLNLSGNRIDGEIPKGLYSLANLVALDLSNNKIVGTIDSDVKRLSNLEVLKLDGNFLSGVFPEELRKLTKLSTFNVEFNLFASNPWNLLPSWPNIENFQISNTLISGSIPTEIGALSRLETVGFAVTSTVGTIPTEIGDLTNLRDISADSTPIEWQLPTEIGNLGKSLQGIALRGCNMIGTALPSELGRCTSLEFLLISMSGVSGTLPSELGMLVSLQVFEANDIYVEGTIPEEFANLVSLEVFSMVGVHSLQGSIPTGMCNLPLHTTLFMSEEVVCQCCDSPHRKM